MSGHRQARRTAPNTSFCSITGPAFFTTFRLAVIETSVFKGGAWTKVDRWNLSYVFPQAPPAPTLPYHASGAPNPIKMSLSFIQRIPYSQTTSGVLGGALPAVDFYGGGSHLKWLPNRADLFDTTPGVSNNVPSTYIPRIGKIVDELGGSREITYVQPAPCASQPATFNAWATNATACFLAETDWWSVVYPYPNDSRRGMFNRYVVQKISDGGLGVTTNVDTTYTYGGAPAWRKPRNPWLDQTKLPWSEWRGYTTTTVTTGSGAATRKSTYRYFRGLNGDSNGNGGTKSEAVSNLDGANPLVDEWWMAGVTYDAIFGNYDANGVWSRTLTSVFETQTTATFNTDNVARRVLPKVVETRIPLRGSKRSYTYDPYGNKTSVTDDDNGDNTPERCQVTTYNINNALAVWITDRPKESMGFRGSCSGTVSSRSIVYYDSQTVNVPPTKGLPTKVEAFAGLSAVTSSSVTYDGYGRVATSTDPGNVLPTTTTTTYVPATGIPTSVKREVAGHIDETSFDRRGMILQQKDVRNNVTTMGYDDLGRVVRVWLPGDPEPLPTHSYAYFLSNTGQSRVQSLVRSGSGTAINSDYSITETLQDGLGRTRQTQMWRDANSTVVTDMAYDSAGALLQRTIPFSSVTPPGAAYVSPPPLTGNKYAYDVLGRQLSDTHHLNGLPQWTTSASYESAWVKVTPPNRAGEQQFGQTWTATDVLGRVTEIREYTPASPNTVASAPVLTKYKYDDFGPAGSGAGIVADPNTTGSSVTVIDGNGNKSHTLFDWLGRKTTARDPDAGTSTFSYFKDGTLSSRTDARNVTLSYTRDAFGRPTTEKQGTTLLNDWTYGTGPTDKGMLISKKSYRNGVAYATNYGPFDNRGRPTTKTYALPADSSIGLAAQNHTFNYGYDTIGHATSMTYPAAGTLPAETVISTWTPFGVSKTVSSPGNIYQADAAFDMVNRPIYVCMSGPCATTGTVISSFGYNDSYADSDGTTRLRVSQFGRVGSPAIVATDTRYDAAGNITKIFDSGAEMQCFNYDGRARLSRAWATSVYGTCDDAGFTTSGSVAPYRQQFGYSAIHNIESRTDDWESAKVYQYPAQGGEAPATIGAGPQPHAVSSIKPQVAGATNAGKFTPLSTAIRLLETRAGIRSGKCPTTPAQCVTLAPNTPLTVKIAGEGGIPTTGAGGIEAILTTLSPVAGGTITVGGTGFEFPANAGRSFSVNPSLTNGSITLTSTVALDVVLDVSGWYSDTNSPIPNQSTVPEVFRPVQARILDTRLAYQVGACPTTEAQCVALTPASTRTIKVAGFSPVPNNAWAVKVAVTTIGGVSGTGEVRLSPTGSPTLTRFVDVQAPGGSRSGVGVVRVGTGGTIDVSLFGVASADVVIDVLGYWTSEPVGPVFKPNTSPQAQLVSNQLVASGETVGIRMAGHAGLPTSGMSSVLLAVTANTSKSTLEGYASLWAGGLSSAPYTAQLYWTRNESPTMVLAVPIGPDGRASFFSSFAANFSFKVLGHYETPVGSGLTFTYDANGNRQTSVDAVAGTTTTYTWDSTSRLEKVCTLPTVPATTCTAPEEVNVYDADGQRLVRKSKVTGSGSSGSSSLQPGFVPSTTGESRDVYTNATHIFWPNLTAGTIGRANIDGTGVNQSFITGIDAPSGITSDGTYLYWTTGGLNDTFGTGGIARAGMDGVTGRNNTFITGASKPIGVAVDANYVYWTNFNSSTIGRASKTGTGVNQSFISSLHYPWSVEVRGAYIYWSNYLLGTGASGNKLGRADIGGTNVNTAFITGGSGPRGIVTDGTYLVLGEPHFEYGWAVAS